MEINTIKDDAKKPIVELFNRLIQVEYDFILNYPRMIDNIANVHEIDDEQLVRDLEYLGKQSVRHFADVDKLAGTTWWQNQVSTAGDREISGCSRYVDTAAREREGSGIPL